MPDLLPEMNHRPGAFVSGAQQPIAARISVVGSASIVGAVNVSGLTLLVPFPRAMPRSSRNRFKRGDKRTGGPTSLARNLLVLRLYSNVFHDFELFLDNSSFDS